MVKHSATMAACVKYTIADQECYADVIPMTDAEEGDGHPADFPEEENEPKSAESFDEECLPAETASANYLPVSFKLRCHKYSGVSDAHFTLPYPPPERIS